MTVIPSPRTSDAPMAFTRDEFWRGAMRAWAAFLAMMLGLEVIVAVVTDLTHISRPDVASASSLSILPLVLMMSLLFGGVISGFGLFIGMPIAHRLARALTRERRVAVHVASYAAFGFGFGALLGGASYAVAFAGSAISVLQTALVAALIGGTLSAVAVTFGWWTVARDAMRADRGAPRRIRRRNRKPDPDALAEDAA